MVLVNRFTVVCVRRVTRKTRIGPGAQDARGGLAMRGGLGGNRFEKSMYFDPEVCVCA